MTSTDTSSSVPAAILLDVQDGIGVLTLNRPAVRNAIDDAMRTQLLDALDRAARDPAIRALVVTGAGSAFCAGGDIKGMKARLDAPAGEVARSEEHTSELQSLMRISYAVFCLKK